MVFYQTYGNHTVTILLTGIQDFDSKLKVAACMKHYIGYSSPINGHDRSPVFLPERFLNQIYQPVFDRAVKEGVLSAMGGT